MRIRRASTAFLMVGGLIPGLMAGVRAEKPDTDDQVIRETVPDRPVVEEPDVSGREAEKPAVEEGRFAHPYGSKAFISLVEDSVKTTGVASVEYFNAWMDSNTLQAARVSAFGNQGRDWTQVLERHRTALENMKDPDQRARRELELGTWLHATVKRALPNYDLGRGFELAYAAQRKERQCLLQSVLISSLLQAMGVDAGIMMMNQNRDGQYTNNTHVVVIIKKSDGRDSLVDASYPETLVAHKGLMATVDGRYRYVRPVYTDDYREITAYREEPSRRMLDTKDVRTLDAAFVRSQVNFYRGERAHGGVLAKATSRAGLNKSVRFFERSLELGPRNPLPAYFLARTLEIQGKRQEAHQQFRSALGLYSQAGWIPNEIYRGINRTRSDDRVARTR